MTENKEIKCNENKKCKMCGKEINERNKVVFYDGYTSEFCYHCFREVQKLFTEKRQERCHPLGWR